jgi:NAD(P)-dependent dehydrogenase (short-subunit alcohol dehydrogenase family)
MTLPAEPSVGEPGAGDEGRRPAAVVTEAGGQLASGIARALAGLGYAVHLTGLDGGLASRAAAELGDPCFGSALDVRSLPACRAAASRTRRRFGTLDVWVNAAAVTSSAAAWELDERTRQRMLDLILTGTINGTLAALEIMRPARAGHVINVIDPGGLRPVAGRALHSAAQHGAAAFSWGALDDLRAEGQTGVSVSCLCPTRKLAGQPQRLQATIAALLAEPRPLAAIPRWRETVIRGTWLWPGSRTFTSRLLAALADPSRTGQSGAGGSPTRVSSRARSFARRANRP